MCIRKEPSFIHYSCATHLYSWLLGRLRQDYAHKFEIRDQLRQPSETPYRKSAIAIGKV
ncbi:rCG36283 [Rattus norvegicus]|uniref:RCG36283 n=1 Tax=Rattus norvegicus TaxID=10116 RepID=A6IQA0_RAT|nr:rCG36283 [Rattus norvegicus]